MQLLQQAIAFNGLPQASWLQFYFMFCFEWSVSQDPIGLIDKWIFTVDNKIHTSYNICMKDRIMYCITFKREIGKEKTVVIKKFKICFSKEGTVYSNNVQFKEVSS
jgi:hypothetical protein